MTQNTIDPQCQAFQMAIEVLGRPWTGLILALLQHGPLRFSELGERCQGVNDKILSQRLKELESRGIVARHVDPGPPVRVSYELTRKGEAFEHVAAAIERWGRSLVGGASGDKKAKAAKTTAKRKATAAR